MVSCVLDLARIEAALFDLDGVVVDSAKLHAQAWQQMFNEFLQEYGRGRQQSYPPFDYQRDYLPLVDGKPRYAGVSAFLSSRRIQLPFGEPEDPPERSSICGLGNRKNRIFNQLLQHQPPEVYAPAVLLIRRLKELRVKTALVTSSTNGRAILQANGLQELFDVVVDGNDALRRRLKGKPQPDAFLLAARQLGVEPQRAAVFEDAQSGVEAGRKGAFGCVIGVDRAGQAEGLRRHGADCVAKGLDQIELKVPLLPSALEAFEVIAGSFSEKRPLLFLDYDGTLTPIVRRAEEAVLSEAMRALLRALGNLCGVAVVSGRDLEDVRRRVGLPELYYAGSHGFEIAGPPQHPLVHRPGEPFAGLLAETARRLREELQNWPGVKVEQKRYALAVHYREAPAAEDGAIAAAVAEVLAQIGGGLRLRPGKKVFDLQPDMDWNKGKAVRWLMREGFRADPTLALPIYLGDDLTDEDAFAELRNCGIGILIAQTNRPSRARYRLRDCTQVFDFLQRLKSALATRLHH